MQALNAPESFATIISPLQMTLTQTYQLKADVAQAYYQLGRTYYAIGNIGKACETLRQADRILTEVEAVCKIEQAFRSR